MSESAQPSLTQPRLIVGLGNPGLDYENTRHNIGFMVLDAYANKVGASWTREKRWNCMVAKLSKGWLVKPYTYMNASGQAVAAVCRFFKIDPAEVLAIYDDVDLPLGKLRFRLNGGAAGHNGVKSLISHLGGDQFPRLKVGISTVQGRPSGERIADYVLGRFSEGEKPDMQISVMEATEAVHLTLTSGLEAAMNLFNRKESTK